MQHTMGEPLASASFARSSGAATEAAAPACTTWRRPVSMDIMGENDAAVPARARTSALRCILCFRKQVTKNGVLPGKIL